MGNKSNLKRTDILTSSEIGQYHFCSMAWYLQRQGYQPDSPMLDLGKDKHISLGNAMDKMQRSTQLSKALSTIGYILLVGVILILLLGVIL